MTLSEYQRRQIDDLVTTTSIEDIAKRIGVNRTTVYRYLKSKKESKRDIAKLSLSPAHAHTPTKVEDSCKKNATLQNVNATNQLSPAMLARVALQHLVSEIALYDEALAEKSSPDEKVRSMAEWKVVNHEKLVQSALRIVAQWFGMDKGDVLKAIEDIRHDPFADMTKEELLKMFEATQ